MKFYSDGMGGDPQALIRVHCPEDPTTEQFLASRADRWQIRSHVWADAPSATSDIWWTGDYEQIPASEVEATKLAIDRTFSITR
jgi:hypothetical protein